MEEVKKLRNQLRELKALVAMDLSDWPTATKNSMVGRQNKAKIDIPEVEQKLFKLLMQNSRTVLQDKNLGDAGVSEVRAASETDSSIVVVDFFGPERQMISDLFKGLSTYSFNTSLISKLNSYMFNVAGQLGIASLPKIEANAKQFKTYPDKESAVNGLADLLEGTYGQELKPIILNKALMMKTVSESEHDSYTIIIYGVPKSWRTTLSLTNDVQIIE